MKWSDRGFKALKEWNFDNEASSWVNMKLSGWVMYDWGRGNPNCGKEDGYLGWVDMPGESYSGWVGDAKNDRMDCLVDVDSLP